ncbi:MAG: GNAT family N-acetyltransferase [Chloroflexi bacterium]|nr:GNAT family N-acetyltransferase [Chloroflexota bacterium]
MFKGQNVLLRAVKREDMNRQWEFENDAHLHFLDGGKPRPSTLDGLLAFYDNTLSKGEGEEMNFSIEVDAKYIGHCGLHNIDQTARSCELGIEIGDSDYWGKGYGREAVKLLLDYAFKHMHMNRVWLNTHSENERAIRCYRACGFVEEGRLRQHLWLNGRYVDRVIMGVLKDEAGA